MSSSNFKIRPAGKRGHADHGWLKSFHTFSFANYYNPAHMGFRTLRVINEDRIEGGSGFGAHPHHDMEIISYVISGGLEHSDSMGNKTVILPDEVQIMSAGGGVVHSEMNHSKDQPAHFFQIWIHPEAKGTSPRYGQKSFKQRFAEHQLTLVVSKDQRDGSIGIQQAADIHIGRFQANDQLHFPIRHGHVWVQMIEGQLRVGEAAVGAGDGVAISDQKQLVLSAPQAAHFILFDLK